MIRFIKAETLESSMEVTLRVDYFDMISAEESLAPIDFMAVSRDEHFFEFAEHEQQRRHGANNVARLRLEAEYEANYELGFKLLSRMEGFEIGKGLGKSIIGNAKPVEAVKQRYVGEKSKFKEERDDVDAKDRLRKFCKIIRDCSNQNKQTLFVKFIENMKVNRNDSADFIGTCISINMFLTHKLIIEKSREDEFGWRKQLDELKDRIELIEGNIEDAKRESSALADFSKVCHDASSLNFDSVRDVNKWLDTLNRILDGYSTEFLDSKYIHFCTLKLITALNDSKLGLIALDKHREGFYIRLFLFLDRYRSLYESLHSIVNLSEKHFVEILSHLINGHLYTALSSYIRNDWDYEDPAKAIDVLTSLKKLDISFCDELCLKLFKTDVLPLIESKVGNWSGEKHGITPFVWVIPWKQYVDILPNSRSLSSVLSQLVTKKIANLVSVLRVPIDDIIIYIKTTKVVLEKKEIKYLLNIVVIPALLWFNSNTESTTQKNRNEYIKFLDEFDSLELYNKQGKLTTV